MRAYFYRHLINDILRKMTMPSSLNMCKARLHLFGSKSVWAIAIVVLFLRPTLADDTLLRGPYLQQATDTGVTVRWRTSNEQDAVVRFGTDATNLDRLARDLTVGTNHSIAIQELSPDTRYYYSIGDSNGSFTSSPEQYFDTHPEPGSTKPTRIWVLGDSGTADARAARVRDAYVGFNGGSHADVWLMLGDNAYNDGTDAEYQNAVFDMYPQTLQNSVLWSTLGNHDGHTADSDTQSGPYYDIFTFPKAGESGGIPSGTEAYYSFDYGNIHFVSLDSYESARFPSDAMETWLQNDLAATTQEWIIAFWHHPPYSKGSHDSDKEVRLVRMREKFLPILENYNVDLVLGGHSHSYERSMLIKGHYGNSSTFDSVHIVDGGDGDPLGAGAYEKSADNNNGAIFSVAGSSGKVQNSPLDHPVMVSNVVELGSLVIDVHDNQLDAVFLNDEGVIRDSFRIIHDKTDTPQDESELSIAEIGSGVLDKTKVDGPSWQRLNFEPLTTGTHTIKVDWNGDAEIRYSIFRASDRERLGRTDITDSPSTWTGEFDASESYYLGVWSVSGSTAYTATIETTDGQPTSPAPVIIGQGSVDSTRESAPRWVRINFEGLATATHNISVSWDSDADVRFRVREVNNTSVSPTIRTASPSEWSGELEADKEYFVGLWSTDDVANFTITVEATNSP